MKVMMSKSLENRIKRDSLKSHFNDDKNELVYIPIDIDDVKSIRRKNDTVRIKFTSSVLDIERTEFFTSFAISKNLDAVKIIIAGNKKHDDREFSIVVMCVNVKLCNDNVGLHRFSIEGQLI